MSILIVIVIDVRSSMICFIRPSGFMVEYEWKRDGPPSSIVSFPREGMASLQLCKKVNDGSALFHVFVLRKSNRILLISRSRFMCCSGTD